MERVNVIYDIGLDYLIEDHDLNHQVKHHKKERLIRITEAIFENLLAEGLIKKTDDGYVFVGKKPVKN